MNDFPAYRNVYVSLKRKIKDGVYKTGTFLPTETELEKQYSVSRTTIRKAISLLAAEGYLDIKQGRGTKILDVSTTQKLNCITSITETLTQKGYHVTVQGMHIEKITAPDFIADILQLPEGSLVYKLQRIQCADNKPIAIMVNYLKASVVPDFEKHINSFIGLYDFLENKYKIIFKDAYETISAMSANFTEAQILQIPVGSPLICSKRVTNIEQGPFEYSIIQLVADKYEYSVYLSGRR